MENIYAILLGGLIGYGGALITFFINRHAEKNKLATDYRQRQIRELYGPLSSLINRTFILHKIFVKMVTTDPDGTEHPERLLGEDGKPHPEKLEGKNKEIWDFFADRYFVPINSQMRDIIHSHRDLLHSIVLPESFQAFLRHEAQFKARRRMEKLGLGVTNVQVEDNPYEEEFNKDVWDTLRELKEDVEKTMGIKPLSEEANTLRLNPAPNNSFNRTRH